MHSEEENINIDEKKPRKFENDENSSDSESRINKYERARLGNVLERKREFWKLRKVLTPNMIFLCRKCKNFNFHIGDNSFNIDSGKNQNSDRLWYRISLCRACVLWNMDVQDLQLRHNEEYYPDFPKKKAKKFD